MKPKEYIKTFKLNEAHECWAINKWYRYKVKTQLYEDFVDTINTVMNKPVSTKKTIDTKEVSINVEENPRITTAEFKNLQKLLMDKVKVILITTGINESDKVFQKFIGYIYATVIISERNRIFPNWSQACLDYKLKTDKDFRFRYEMYQYWKQENEFYEDMFRRGFGYSFDEGGFTNLGFDSSSNKNSNANNVSLEFVEKCLALGFKDGEDINSETIKDYFRIQTKRYHPDLGGDTEKFLKVKEYSDFITSYLETYGGRKEITLNCVPYEQSIKNGFKFVSGLL